jgi:co-chaperonin GroES (HSP10)
MKMRWNPAGFTILIKPDYEKKTESGLVIVESDRSGVAAVDTGVIVKIGPTAWKAYDNGLPWAKVGDRVGYAKHAGRLVPNPDDSDDKYVLVADGDIRLVMETEETSND